MPEAPEAPEADRLAALTPNKTPPPPTATGTTPLLFPATWAGGADAVGAGAVGADAVGAGAVGAGAVGAGAFES